MKTNIHFLPYCAHSALQWDVFQTKVAEKIKTYILCSITFISNSVLFIKQCGKILYSPPGHRWYVTCTRAVPKLMPPILLCWLTTSEANIVDMAVEVEPSRQYSIKFCCRATDDSRGAVWQNGVWHGSAYETKVCNWIPPCGKNCTQWHSATLAERLRRPNSGC